MSQEECGREQHEERDDAGTQAARPAPVYLEPRIIEVPAEGVTTLVAVFLAALVLLFGGTAIYEAGRVPEAGSCGLQDATVRAQAEATKAQAQYQLGVQKQEVEMRLAVVKTCVNAGGIPIFSGGNIDCKAAPK